MTIIAIKVLTNSIKWLCLSSHRSNLFRFLFFSLFLVNKKALQLPAGLFL
jgi:hypothetical protein